MRLDAAPPIIHRCGGVFVSSMNPLNCFHTYRYNNSESSLFSTEDNAFCDEQLTDEPIDEDSLLDLSDANDNESKKKVCHYIDCLIRSQAWKSRCEARLFCNATDRLSYELKRAKNLCEVNCLINNVHCLLSASAMKDFGTAEVLKGYAMACGYKHKDYCCCCKD